MRERIRTTIIAALTLGVLALLLASCGPETRGAEPVVGESASGGAALQSPINTPTPTPPPSQPGPTPTRVPLCTPPDNGTDGQPPAEEDVLDALAFGDPQVILTDTAPIDIAGWMPDGRSLLLVRQLPRQQAQAIESYDIRSGRTMRYAEAITWAGQVFPLAQGQGVGFMAQAETVEGQLSPGVDLKISHGPGQVEPVVRGVPFRAMAVDPTTASLVRYAQAPGGPPALPPQARQDFRVLTVPVDPYLWKYPTYFPDRIETGYSGDVFQAAVRPDGAIVAFYADPYLFLYDLATERACEVDLGVAENGQPRFTWDARWSPDGRYLAMLTSARFPGELLPFADLTILDSFTGRTRTVNPSPQRLVDAFTWSPNGQWLILQGRLEHGRLVNQLHLVNAADGNAVPLLPNYSFAPGVSNGVSWAPAKSFVALSCHVWPENTPFITEQRICLIPTPLRDKYPL